MFMLSNVTFVRMRWQSDQRLLNWSLNRHYALFCFNTTNGDLDSTQQFLCSWFGIWKNRKQACAKLQLKCNETCRPLKWQVASPLKVKVKVKHTLIQALRLCTGRTAHRGSGGIVLPFHDLGTRRGWGVSVTPRPLFTPRRDPVSIVQEEAGWAPGPVWIGAENLGSTGIWSPDRPARSQSLYRLSYTAQEVAINIFLFLT
jgi:hypothetical protein